MRKIIAISVIIMAIFTTIEAKPIDMIKKIVERAKIKKGKKKFLSKRGKSKRSSKIDNQKRGFKGKFRNAKR